MYLLCRTGTVLLVAALISGCGHGGPTGERSAENASHPAEPAVPVPSFSAAEKVGMFVYPKNNQSKDQQLRDELDCYNQVQQQTGINPETPPPRRSFQLASASGTATGS